jgi:cobalt-zinc-cadmium efflux system membrane fusion protein
MTNRFFVLLLFLVLPWFAPSASAQDEHDHDDHAEQTTHEEHESQDEHEDHDDHESGFVRLTDAQMAEFGIAMDTASPGTISNAIVVPGEVAVNGDRIAHIVPRFTGVVNKVLKRVGDRVKEGDVLAVVESNEGLTPYDVTALMDGTVIDKQIAVGEVHQGDTPAFTIADLNEVWVNLNIYQMHFSEIVVGLPAAITSDHGANYVDGELSYVSPVVDEHTRTATARVVLNNRSGKWRPGMLVEGRIATNLYSADVVVPKSAIFQIDEVDVVFVLTPEGFRPQPVQVGKVNHTNAAITEGLTLGQAYAASGGFTIKAELQKGSFGDGHGH